MRIKSAFTKPTISNSFRKTDRIYPQSQKLVKNSETQRNQSLNKVKQPPKLQSNIMIKTPVHILKHNSDKISQRYYLFLQEQFQINQQNSPETLISQNYIWYRKLQNSVLKKSKRFIRFRQTDYTISNWIGDQYPNSISICIEGFYGYLDVNGCPTDRIAVLELQQAQPSYGSDTLRSYQIHYRMRGQMTWQIPQQLTSLKFYLLLDDQNLKIQLPLPNPLTLDIQIMYE